MTTSSSPDFKNLLAAAEAHAQRGQFAQAEGALIKAQQLDPAHDLPYRGLVGLYMHTEDWAKALGAARSLAQLLPQDVAASFELAQLLWANQKQGDALAEIARTVSLDVQHHEAWLLMGHWRKEHGDAMGAAKAWFQAIHRAQSQGLWLSPQTLDLQVQQEVLGAMASLRVDRKAHLSLALDAARAAHGAKAIERIERGLLAYLGEVPLELGDARQNPKVFNVPGLPSPPYHDPYLQPWAKTLQAGWKDIRAEALAVVNGGQNVRSFLDLKPGDDVKKYVSGAALNPAWDAYFFYRHGERFDANHAACPITSALLESMELCRIDQQSPEICFSVLRPGSTIERHYGVTNARLVTHLPLIVPPDCALNLIDASRHTWKEGELMMFDDTYHHEAWNKSAEVRIILLMDCWNPYLTPPERMAFKALIECITEFERV
jgi:aspartate beta-hydroxylase